MHTQLIFNNDLENATVYIMKIYNATVDEVWNHFTKADLLDEWWAPKPWKCETKILDFRPQGSWNYAMIGPENEEHFAGATYHEINHHRSFDWTDFFADENGNINSDLPTSNWLIGFTGIEEGTKVTINIHFKSSEDMRQLLEMGFEEGFKMGLNQLEEILHKKD